MIYLKKYISFISLGIIFLAAISTISFLLPKVDAANIYLLSPLPEENVVLGATTINAEDNTSSPIALKRKINILVLGLDGRIGDSKPRCDAIHMLSIDNKKKNILITSLPRGTAVQIPDQDKESSYIANACHFLGIEKTKSEIEKILKIKSDYTVKVGFSQVMGILRSIKLPASDTLQFLRNRSVVFGDYQRSHNQGVFIKDMIVNHLREFNNIPKPLTYFIYKTIDTDLPYDLFYTIAENLNEANFKQSPEKITLVTKTAEDLPFSDKHLYNSLNNTNTNSEDLQDFQDFQKTVQEKTDKIINTAKNYYDLQNLNACYNIIKTPFQQRIWYQMENENQRYENEYQILKTYVECSSDKTNLSSAVLDFINEMEIGNQPDYKKRGEELLSQIIDNR